MTSVDQQIGAVQTAGWTGGIGAATSIGLHTAIMGVQKARPHGRLATTLWPVTMRSVTRSTLGAGLMLGAVGLGVGELKQHRERPFGVAPDNGVVRALQSVAVGAVLGAVITRCGPIFHGTQQGIRRSTMINAGVGSVTALVAHTASSGE